VEGVVNFIVIHVFYFWTLLCGAQKRPEIENMDNNKKKKRTPKACRHVKKEG